MPAGNRKEVLCLLGVMATLFGCDSSPFDIVPVSGTVTLDGKPLTDANVTFNPRASGDSLRAGPDSYARTDATGRFELATLNGVSGAVVATHRVRIRTRRQKEGSNGEVIVVSEETLPAKYHDSTELTFQVTDATKSADFSLTSD